MGRKEKLQLIQSGPFVSSFVCFGFFNCTFSYIDGEKITKCIIITIIKQPTHPKEKTSTLLRAYKFADKPPKKNSF